jgi:SAM-dependent methyltransferase
MRFYTYIKYFYFLASRWNLRIAWHIMWKEVNGEKKYGIQTTGADELNQLEDLGIDTSYATIYIPASYDLLEAVFTELMQKKLAHFIDIGCGKGRVLCVAAHFGFKNITGIDFSKELCDQAKINLEKTKKPNSGHLIQNHK